MDVPSSYNFGWSQGKESLESGHFDVHKGSWYANPLVDDPVGGDQLLMERYPAYCRCVDGGYVISRQVSGAGAATC